MANGLCGSHRLGADPTPLLGDPQQMTSPVLALVFLRIPLDVIVLQNLQAGASLMTVLRNLFYLILRNQMEDLPCE